MKEYALESSNSLPKEKFDSIVLTVSHKEFKNLDFSLLKKENAIIYDVKNSLKVRYAFMKQTNLLSSVTADIFRCKSDT